MAISSQIYQDAPYKSTVVITPSDTVDLPSVIRAVYVLTSGNLAVRLSRDASPTTLPVTAGQLIRLNIKRVYAANTTATVVGLN